MSSSNIKPECEFSEVPFERLRSTPGTWFSVSNEDSLFEVSCDEAIAERVSDLLSPLSVSSFARAENGAWLCVVNRTGAVVYVDATDVLLFAPSVKALREQGALPERARVRLSNPLNALLLGIN